MASVSPSVALWVKAEPFTFGALPVAPHPRLTVSNIKRIVTYAKNKGKQGFPRLSYAVWKHIALKKLELSLDITWMYFTTYKLTGGETEPDERMEWDSRFSQCKSSAELEAVRSLMSVNTLKFVLFLYIQQLNRISLRASLVSGNDEWPMRSRSPSPDLDSSRSGGKCMDEQAHLTFVRNNLDEIMELLVEPAGGDAADLALSIEAIEALGFLIAGSVDRSRSIKPLQDIALMQQMHQKTGYSKVNVETSRSSKGLKLVISRSFSYRSLQSWLRQHLDTNPFGFATCIAQGRRLSWPLGGSGSGSSSSSSSDHTSKPGRIATNALAVPKDSVKGNKLIIMSQVCRQTIARSSGTLEHSGMKVHRCHNSYIYLLSPLRFVSVEKCRHSTIVLGAVETTVHVSHCEGCTIITATRRLTISNSNHVTLHLLSPNRPLVFAGNSHLIMAPYNTFYGTLGDHLDTAGIGTDANEWDKPLCVGPEHTDDAAPVWELMSPNSFFVFSVPFNIPGSTTKLPVELPQCYSTALSKKEKQVDHWQRSLRGLTRDQKCQLQSVVEQRFQDWLHATGHRKELDTLSVTKSQHDSS